MGFRENPENINRKGRPKKGRTMTDLLEAYGKLINTEDKELTNRQALAKKIWEMAMDGDTTAIKYIYDRIDGKPRETVAVDQKGNIVVSFDAAEKDL